MFTIMDENNDVQILQLQISISRITQITNELIWVWNFESERNTLRNFALFKTVKHYYYRKQLTECTTQSDKNINAMMPYYFDCNVSTQETVNVFVFDANNETYHHS